MTWEGAPRALAPGWGALPAALCAPLLACSPSRVSSPPRCGVPGRVGGKYGLSQASQNWGIKKLKKVCCGGMKR